MIAPGRVACVAAALLVAAPAATQERWWSLRPMQAPAVPAAAAAWGRNDIDAFVAARLRSAGLQPSPPADRRTLIRRLTFDLHGLPPRPEDVERFERDMRPDAYARLVDALLASPRYGERWGRHWLDVVHYGDTHGYDKDKPRHHAWRYRDYVIAAINEDRPYRQFVREQLAGDVLEPAAAGAVAATGFIAAGPWDFVGHVELAEGTVQKKVTRSLDRDDMVMTAMSTFVATTVHCARCHDHKRDPVPQRDYYRLQAVFAGVERGNRGCGDAAWRRQRDAIAEREQALQRRQAALQRAIAALRGAALAAVDAELAAVQPRLASDVAPVPAVADGQPGSGYHSAIAEAADAVKWVQVDLGAPTVLDWLVLVPTHEAYGGHDGPGFGFPPRFVIDVSDDPQFAHRERLVDQTAADFPHPGDRAVVFSAGGVRGRYVRITATRLWQRTGDWIFALGELLVHGGGQNRAAGAAVTALDSLEAAPRWGASRLTDGVGGRRQLAGDGRVATWIPSAAQWTGVASRAASLATRRAVAVERLLPDALREERAALAAGRAALERDRAALPPEPMVYAAVPLPAPRPIHRLARGDVRRPGDPVAPGALSCLPELEHHFAGDMSSEGTRRAALAAWITDRDNPLTWRVAVNRIWLGHFGRGLVDTPNDFGRFGARPSHPRLLDWLAVWFRDGGGSMADLHRLIVNSATYRQSGHSRPEAAAIDGDNRLLWRMPRRRLEAEAVRDAMLAVAGVIDLRMGGPGAQWFAFEDDHSPRYDYRDFDPGDPAALRRGVYRFAVRSVPDPFMEVLDCADPSQLTPQRYATVTAPQALALLDNPFAVRMAELFAERLAAEAAPQQRVARACRLALGRPPRPEESAAMAAFAARHGWPSLCRALFNLNEFVFVD